MWTIFGSWLLGVLMTMVGFSYYPQMGTILFFIRGMLQFQVASVYYRCRMPKKVGLDTKLVRRQLRPPTVTMAPNLSPHQVKNDNRDSLDDQS
jgi:hypothetical protein